MSFRHEPGDTSCLPHLCHSTITWQRAHTELPANQVINLQDYRLCGSPKSSHCCHWIGHYKLQLLLKLARTYPDVFFTISASSMLGAILQYGMLVLHCCCMEMHILLNLVSAAIHHSELQLTLMMITEMTFLLNAWFSSAVGGKKRTILALP